LFQDLNDALDDENFDKARYDNGDTFVEAPMESESAHELNNAK